MIIPLSFHFRQAILSASKFETEVSKSMQEYMIELGKPELRKATDEQLREKILGFMKGLVGKGLSQEAYDNFESVIKTKYGRSSILKYYADFMLAGAGLKVQKTAVEDVSKDIITIGGKQYYHPLFRIMKKHPTIKGEFKADKIEGIPDVDGSQSFYFKNLDPELNSHIKVVGPGKFKIVDDESESSEMDETKLTHELSYVIQMAQSPDTKTRRRMHIPGKSQT